MANDSAFRAPVAPVAPVVTVVPVVPVVPECLVAISLGSNLGDRDAHLRWAVDALGADLSDLRVSSFHDTAPIDVDGPQPRYLNAVVVGRTTLSARALLDRLLALERARGRERPSPRAPRTLDLDLILYGEAIINEPGLTVPHPQFHRRRFVLDPLSEVASQMVDPRTGKTIGQMRDAVHTTGRRNGLRLSLRPWVPNVTKGD